METKVKEFLESAMYDRHHGCLDGDCPHEHANDCLKELTTLLNERSDEAKALLNPESYRVLLVCPKCSERHIDKGEFAKRLHHTHQCNLCGFQWRVEPYCFGA